jgi:hypothetical protein
MEGVGGKNEYRDNEASELVMLHAEGMITPSGIISIDLKTSKSIIKNKVESNNALYMILQECRTESLKISTMANTHVI